MADFEPDIQAQDNSILKHIKELVAEEQRLIREEDNTPEGPSTEHERLAKIQVELDQYWDLLRQRRALRDAGENPETAKLRDPNIVENYEG
ncbi:MAG TPA: DUF2630 family protein [Rhodothermales bacterium]|nr:DUF2630 family protein [Rhodothermales bacterium]